jgi:hypothetical protein
MKRTCKYILVASMALVVLAMTVPVSADSSCKGTMSIDYNTRVQTDSAGKPLLGVADLYTLDLKVADNGKPKVRYYGTIKHLPTISSRVLGREKQAARLVYDIKLSVFRSTDGREIEAGKIAGVVPITPENVYEYSRGTLETITDTVGIVEGFRAPFKGRAFGKPKEDTSTLGSITKQAKAIKVFQNKAGKIVVDKYDVMKLENALIGAGPGRGYSEVGINGAMTYCYKRYVWFFDEGFNITTTIAGKPVQNRLSGNVKWTESEPKGGIREGAYRYDVRYNETIAPGGEAKFFQEENEDAFFAVDPSLVCITGTMSYKDTMEGQGEDATPVKSVIVVDLTGNKVHYLDLRAFVEMSGFLAVVPWNEE